MIQARSAWLVTPVLLTLVLCCPALLFAQPIIGVAPFENINRTPDAEWLAVGISEAVLSDLKVIRSVRLVERVQLQRVIDEQRLQVSDLVDPLYAASVGRLLGASHLVVGSYQISEGTVRIVARIVSVESGEVVEATKVTGAISEIFALQDHIVRSLERSLKFAVTPQERETLKLVLTRNAEAYASYIKGLRKWEHMQPAWDLNEQEFSAWCERNTDCSFGMEEFEAALKLDPTFPEPLFYLAADRPLWYWQFIGGASGRNVDIELQGYKMAAASVHLALWANWMRSPDAHNGYRLARYYVLVADDLRLMRAKQIIEEIQRRNAAANFSKELHYLRGILEKKLREKKYTKDVPLKDLEGIAAGDAAKAVDAFFKYVLVPERQEDFARVTAARCLHDVAPYFDVMTRESLPMVAGLGMIAQICAVAISRNPDDPSLLFAQAMMAIEETHTSLDWKKGWKVSVFLRKGSRHPTREEADAATNRVRNELSEIRADLLRVKELIGRRGDRQIPFGVWDYRNGIVKEMGAISLRKLVEERLADMDRALSRLTCCNIIPGL